MATGRLRRPVFILHTGKNGMDTKQITDRERRFLTAQGRPGNLRKAGLRLLQGLSKLPHSAFQVRASSPHFLRGRCM
ncbi:hypothetical protein BBA71_13525 [Acetobacter pasteurianus]|nr:hypothetical protein BBA71_13525 [Acetobacter pasteurianus]